MTQLSDYEQRQLDITSGEELDRRGHANVWRNAARSLREEGAKRRNLKYRKAHELSAAHCDQLADALDRGEVSVAPDAKP